MRAPAHAVILVLLAIVPALAGGDDLGTRAARSYVLETARSPTTLHVGERGAVAVAIRCEPGVHVQSQAPLRVQASASTGLVLARERLGWADVRGGPGAPEVELSVTGTAPGSNEVRVRLEFFVCSSEWCVRQDREVVVPVAVERGTGD